MRDPIVGEAVRYDGREARVVAVDRGEYGARATLQVDGSEIRTTLGLDPRFQGFVNAELEGHIAEWLKLRDEAAQRAVHEDSIGNTGTAQVWWNKADLYQRTVHSMREEQRTGVLHCVCCLKPIGRRS